MKRPFWTTSRKRCVIDQRVREIRGGAL